MKKVNYLVTAKCEALYEYANSVMAKYEDCLLYTSDAADE